MGNGRRRGTLGGILRQTGRGVDGNARKSRAFRRLGIGGWLMLTAGELIWLIAAVARRDETAFERLYAATRDRLYGIVLRILGKPEIAERVLVEAYLQIWRSAATFDPKGATPMTWMVAIARDRALDLARRTPQFAPDPSGPVEVSLDALDQAASEVTDELRHLLSCLARLDDAQRQLVLLAYSGGWNRDQLAARFAQPAQAVKESLRQTLLQMRATLGP